MDAASPPLSIVVMGVSGAGKSTVGKALAGRLGFDFVEADELHSPYDVAKMAAGHALTDEDRAPWLRAVGARLSNEATSGRSAVAACSALRRSYRDVLREYVPAASFVLLTGPVELIRDRLAHRHAGFMPIALLDSQFATLEPPGPDEHGITVDALRPPDEIVERIVAALPGLR